MKNCINEEILLQYTERVLSRRERRIVERHLHVCEACAARLTEYTEMEQQLRMYARPEPAASTRNKYYSSLDRMLRDTAVPLGMYNRNRSIIAERKLVWGVVGFAAVILVLVLIKPIHIREVSTLKSRAVSRILVVQDNTEQIKAFIDESEILLLEIKNAEDKVTYMSNKQRARKLISMVPVMHDIGLEQNNTSLLSYLIQSELLFYELANFEETSAIAKISFIKEAVNSKRLWKTLNELQNSYEGAGDVTRMYIS